jgi:hypothetical protein
MQTESRVSPGSGLWVGSLSIFTKDLEVFGIRGTRAARAAGDSVYSAESGAVHGAHVVVTNPAKVPGMTSSAGKWRQKLRNSSSGGLHPSPIIWDSDQEDGADAARVSI